MTWIEFNPLKYNKIHRRAAFDAKDQANFDKKYF